MFYRHALLSHHSFFISGVAARSAALTYGIHQPCLAQTYNFVKIWEGKIRERGAGKRGAKDKIGAKRADSYKLLCAYQLRAGAKPPEPPEPVDAHFNFAGRRDRSLSPTKGKAP